MNKTKEHTCEQKIVQIKKNVSLNNAKMISTFNNQLLSKKEQKNRDNFLALEQDYKLFKLNKKKWNNLFQFPFHRERRRDSSLL